MSMRAALHHSLFVFILCHFIFSPRNSSAQSLLFPGDYLFTTQLQRAVLTDTNEIIHSSLQPYPYKSFPPDTFQKLKPGADPFWDKVFYESLIRLRHIDRSSGFDRKFNLDINPIMNFMTARDQLDSTDPKISTNTRGFWLRGELGKKFRFESCFMENQSVLPNYLKNYADCTEVIPGQGRWKTFKKTGFDYSMACAVLQFDAGKNFSGRLGHGKQKIGNGYRSLLLSDNSFNYPYLQFIATFFKNKLQYSQTYALLMNLTTGGSKIPPGTERIFQKKAASFQHLSWHASKYLDLYLFQGMIWQATDSNNVMHLDAFYANPVIFSNLAKYGFNDKNHILVGYGFELRPVKKTSVYFQVMYDGKDTSGKNLKFAYQAGTKLFDVFTVKNLFLQYEFNYVSENAYRNQRYSAQDYSHYGQSLATPALFRMEHIAMLSYNYKRFFVQLKEIYCQNENPRDNQHVNFFDAKIGYMVNRHYNLNISAGTTLRMYQYGTAKPQQMQLFYVSLRTSLYNLYYDF